MVSYIVKESKGKKSESGLAALIDTVKGALSFAKQCNFIWEKGIEKMLDWCSPDLGNAGRKESVGNSAGVPAIRSERTGFSTADLHFQMANLTEYYLQTPDGEVVAQAMMPGVGTDEINDAQTMMPLQWVVPAKGSRQQ